MRSSQGSKEVKLFSSWFCPYAQRAWIALEEKGVDYEIVSIIPYVADASKPGGLSKNPLSLEEKKKKYPEFIAASPKGLVPAIQRGEDRIYESLVCVEYVDEAFPEGPSLLPADPAKRARARIWASFVSESINPHFYRMLMKPSNEEREDEKKKLVENLVVFARAADSVGPYFLGDAFSLADISLIPWWRRYFSIGATYRGLDLKSDERLRRLWIWAEACEKRPSVANTIVDQQRLTENYSSYADGTATSTVAKTLVLDK